MKPHDYLLGLIPFIIIIGIFILIGLAVKEGNLERYDPGDDSGDVGCARGADCY